MCVFNLLAFSANGNEQSDNVLCRLLNFSYLKQIGTVLANLLTPISFF